MSLLIVVFGFFFVTVSSRIVGIIGTSSNPISGMTIATLMMTCVVFVVIGWKGDVYQAVALCVGAIVCVAAANAGATSQDLKTGYLVGATPRRAADRLHHRRRHFLARDRRSRSSCSTRPIAGTEAHGIGGPQLAAPQATLMATIIKGLLAQNLPWAPVLVGVFLAFMAQLAGAHALSWAVGAYLPVSTTAPIWIGGMIEVDRRRLAAQEGGRRQARSRSCPPGCSTPTGLVAGGSLGGVLIAFVAFFGDGVLHMEKPTLLEKLDLGNKMFSRHQERTGARRHPLRDRVRAALLLLLEERAEEARGLALDRVRTSCRPSRTPRPPGRGPRARGRRRPGARRRAWPCGTTGKPNPDT